MYKELLFHGMVEETDPNLDLKSLVNEQSELANKLNVNGCFLYHKPEVLYYISGKEEAILKCLNSIRQYSFLKSFRELLTEDLSEPIVSGFSWHFSAAGHLDSSSKTAETFSSLKERIKEVQQSLGMMLFTSVAEIILSEKLYKLD